MTITFKILDNWQQRTDILERKQTSEVSPKIAPDYYLENVFTMGRKGNSGRDQWSP